MCQSEVGERIANLKALVKPLATIDPIGNSLSQQSLFKHPGLCIGAIQNSDRTARVTIAEPSLGLFDNVARLILFVKTRIQGNRLATLSLRPQTFTQPSRIAGNQPIGRLENGLGGAVVLLQTNGFCLPKVLCEPLDIFDARTAPAVNGLIVVTHGNNRNTLARKHPQPGILNGVGILKLINQDGLKPLLVVLQRLGRFQPQLMRTQEQLCKVNKPAAFTGFFIGGINTHHGLGI